MADAIGRCTGGGSDGERVRVSKGNTQLRGGEGEPIRQVFFFLVGCLDDGGYGGRLGKLSVLEEKVDSKGSGDKNDEDEEGDDECGPVR